MHWPDLPATIEPNATQPMSRLNLILLPSMLALALPGWAADESQAARGRPLNLSLPRDVLHAPGTPQIDETVERNLRAPAPQQDGANAPGLSPTLPYGAGYEHRHREMDGAGVGAGAGAGVGAAGARGGGGRRGR